MIALDALPADVTGVHAVWRVATIVDLEAFAAWPDPPPSASSAIVLRADTVPHPCAPGVSVRLGTIDSFAHFVLEQFDAFRARVEEQEHWSGPRPHRQEAGLWRPDDTEATRTSWLRPGFACGFVALAAWARFALRGEIVDGNEALRWTQDIVGPMHAAMSHLVVSGTLGMEPENPGITVSAFLGALAAVRSRLQETIDARELAIRSLYARAKRVVEDAEHELETARLALMNSGVLLAEGRITPAEADECRSRFERANAAIPNAEAKRDLLVAQAQVLPERRFLTRADPLCLVTMADVFREAGFDADAS